MMARSHRLSTHEIMRISRAWFTQFSSEKLSDLSTIQHFFDGSQFGLSREEIKDVELAILLIATADKVGNKQFDDASKLLNLCHFLSSNQGHAVQRTVHFFSKALQERIAQETMAISWNGFEFKETRVSLCPGELKVGANPALISCCLQLPCLQAVLFAGIQAILDSIGSAKKIHFIDLGIKTGGHCTILMQALANRQDCPVELLKITGVGVVESRQRIENAGKSLVSFAKTLDLPFSFKNVIVTNIKDLESDMFEINNDEVAAIFLPSILRYVKPHQDCLEYILRLLEELNPCVLVIIEYELNHNTPIFIGKFREVLHFYSTIYDGVDGCISHSDVNRMTLESCIGDEIRDIIAAKDDENIYEHMKIEEWRDYLTRHGMVETEVSMSSFYQAELMLKKYDSGRLCLLVRNGKCLITGWKGTPINSLSTWRFQQEQSKRNCTKKPKIC